MNWYQKRFIVERGCTCPKGQRTAECRGGWHAIDGHDDLGAALADAHTMANLQHGKYRVTESKTGDVVGQPIDFRPVKESSK